MGKLKDDVGSAKPTKPGGMDKRGESKPSKAKASRPRGLFAQFVLNLPRTDLYKPMQGWYVRVYTAVGLGLIAGAGAWRIYDTTKEYPTGWHYGLTTTFAVALGWLIFRIVHFPPFAEFLIATEAEMNKVSWTSKDDLIRATTVVLTTVVIMAVFLFLVDTLWTYLLQWLGVLNFSGGGGLGSTA